MKKSEAYQLAQIAVVNSPCISPERKVEIMRYLFADEDLAAYCEEQEAKKAADEE